MGNPLYSDDIGAMCFNAAKSWQLGWYDDSKIVIDPREGSWRGTVIGVADYDNNPQNHPVIVKIDSRTGTDQFITFNRAAGINRHNKEADNEVIIMETGSDGEWFSQSYLQATLRSGEVHIYSKWDGALDLIVTAQAININTGGSAGYAEISVCLGPCTFPTEHPSAQPSINPTKAPTGVPSSVPSESFSIDGPIHYTQMGAKIDGQASDGELGHAVSISKDGLRVAITAPGENGCKGIRRVFDWMSSTEDKILKVWLSMMVSVTPSQ
jgi:hypothetical protein